VGARANGGSNHGIQVGEGFFTANGLRTRRRTRRKRRRKLTKLEEPDEEKM
jgi:hypothetical protein